VKFGSELDHAMRRRSNRRDDSEAVNAHLRRARACTAASGRITQLGASFKLKAADGIPATVSADGLGTLGTDLAAKEDLVRGDDNARRCFLKPQSTSGANAITRNNLTYHLKRCTTAIDFFTKAGAPAKYPTSGKSKAQLEAQKKKVQARYDAVDKIVQKQIVAGRAKRAVKTCTHFYSFFKMATRYGISKSKWMSCCKRESATFSEDKKGGTGILLRRCGK